MTKQRWIQNLTTSLVVLLMGGIIIGPASIFQKKSEKLEKSVQDAYTLPKNVSMEITDLDKDGKYESTFKYNNQTYLMKYNQETNRVSLIPVEVKTQILEEKVEYTNN